jgi:hypothetical protein
MAKKTFKVAGVTFSNGMFSTSRQEIIKKKCKVGDPILLERDYSNKHDDYAVKVLTKEGEQIGFIPKGKAKSKRVFLSLESKNNLTAKISNKYNFKDDYNDRIYGLEIEVDNLLSANEAKEIDQKGCVGVLLLFTSLITLLKIIF